MGYFVLHGTDEFWVKNIFKLKRLYETDRVDSFDVVKKDGAKSWRTVGDTLGLTYGLASEEYGRAFMPSPPPVSWWAVSILGAVTFGYALSIVALIQAVWARKIERRWAPVLLAWLSVLTPPAHLVWTIRSVLQGASHLSQALLELLIGFVVAEIIGFLFITLASLSIRRTLLRKFSEQGFRMSWSLTASFSSVYVAYAIEDLWNSYR